MERSKWKKYLIWARKQKNESIKFWWRSDPWTKIFFEQELKTNIYNLLTNNPTSKKLVFI